jgi:hypothetical protein
VAEARIFPLHYAPIVMQVDGKRMMRLARYHCRKPGEPAFIDKKLPGLYNAFGALLTVSCQHWQCLPRVCGRDPSAGRGS